MHWEPKQTHQEKQACWLPSYAPCPVNASCGGAPLGTHHQQNRCPTTAWVSNPNAKQAVIPKHLVHLQQTPLTMHLPEHPTQHCITHITQPTMSGTAPIWQQNMMQRIQDKMTQHTAPDQLIQTCLQLPKELDRPEVPNETYRHQLLHAATCCGGSSAVA